MENDNKRTFFVTNSMMRAFKQCRKRYEFEYVRQIVPLETPKPLEIGTLYHTGIELLLRGARIGDIEGLLMKNQTEKCASRGIDFDPLNVRIVMQMIIAFYRASGWQEWNIQAIEKEFEVTTGYAKRLRGKIDGIVKWHNGKNLLIEHKTTSQYGEEYLHNLLWDEQSTNYLYAYNRMLADGVIESEQVDGILYCILEKPSIKRLSATPADKRRFTKEGNLYAGQRLADETDDEFIERCKEWYSREPRCHIYPVYRTPENISEHIKDVNLVIKDMIACEREETFYRNPSACQIMSCPYRSKCLDDVPDTDILFRNKTHKNEELNNEIV